MKYSSHVKCDVRFVAASGSLLRRSGRVGVESSSLATAVRFRLDGVVSPRVLDAVQQAHCIGAGGRLSHRLLRRSLRSTTADANAPAVAMSTTARIVPANVPCGRKTAPACPKIM
jgi:hypothetical protein